MTTLRRDLDPDFSEALILAIGNDEEIPIYLKKSDGTAWDLSTATSITFTVKEYAQQLDTDAIVQIAVNLAGPGHDLPNGLINLRVGNADTAGKTPGKYIYDLRVEWPAWPFIKNFPDPAGECILRQPTARDIP